MYVFLLASSPTKTSYTPVVHPELHFVTHIPHTGFGEQLVAQLFRCIPEKSWLFKYGRIPMSFILADWVWQVGFRFGVDLIRHSQFPENLRTAQGSRAM